MPNDIQFKFMNGVHQAVHRLTGGRLADKFYGMPVVMLTVKGRKSGQSRTVALTSPVRDGEDVVLIASRGGDDRDPDWYKNLVVHPDVEIEMAGKKRRMTARTATLAEKAELWPRVVAAYKGYGQYQTKTDRDIPVVILTPA